MTPEELRDLAAKEKAAQPKDEITLNVCVAAGCMSSGSDKVKDALTKAAVSSPKPCRVKGVGCMGLCEAGPLVQMGENGTLYKGVTEADAPDVLKSLAGAPVSRLVWINTRDASGRRPGDRNPFRGIQASYIEAVAERPTSTHAHQR